VARNDWRSPACAWEASVVAPQHPHEWRHHLDQAPSQFLPTLFVRSVAKPCDPVVYC